MVVAVSWFGVSGSEVVSSIIYGGAGPRVYALTSGPPPDDRRPPAPRPWSVESGLYCPARMSILLRALYQAATGLALVTAGPVLLARRGRHYLPTLSGRLGRYPPGSPGPPGSPAAAGAARCGSTPSRSARSASRRRSPGPCRPVSRSSSPPSPPPARSGRAPPSPAAPRSPTSPSTSASRCAGFFRRFAPRALVLVEGDYWPLLLAAARRRGLPVTVVNGRVSDRSFARMRASAPAALAALRRGRPLRRADRGGPRAARRPRGRGRARRGHRQPQVRVAGAAGQAAAGGPARQLAAGRPILVAGSTMPGEEPQVLAAFARAGGGERALLVLAPRHPERLDEVDRFLLAQGAVRGAAELAPERRQAGRRPARQRRRARGPLPPGGRRLHRRHAGAHRRPQPAGGGPLRRAGRGRPLDAQLPRDGRGVRPRRRLAAGDRTARSSAPSGARWLDDPAAPRRRGRGRARLSTRTAAPSTARWSCWRRCSRTSSKRRGRCASTATG